MSRLRDDATEMLREQLEFRELLVQMTARDLMLRYKQTVMGFGWALFMPLLNTVIFSVIFMRVAPIETPVPYPVFVYYRLLAWNFIASALRFAVSSLTREHQPGDEGVFPARDLAVFGGAGRRWWTSPSASIVLIAHDGLLPHRAHGRPCCSCRWCLWCSVDLHAGVSLLLAMANLFYRDVKYLFEVALTVWMFASAIVYPLESMQGGRLATLLQSQPDDADHRCLPRT